MIYLYVLKITKYQSVAICIYIKCIALDTVYPFREKGYNSSILIIEYYRLIS